VQQKSSRCLVAQWTSQQASLQVNSDKNIAAKAAWTDLSAAMKVQNKSHF